MYTYLRYTWDSSKSARNLIERGFDFDFATLIFDGFTLERADVRRDYGERRIVATSPPELANLPAGFWARARLTPPIGKQAISLRVDADVLTWFRKQGPRYQSRMNAVLRAYMRHESGRA